MSSGKERIRSEQATTEWVVVERSPFRRFFKKTPQYEPYRQEFIVNVSTDPFYYAPHPGRISKLHGYPPDTYRWKKADVRVVYEVARPVSTVYALDAGLRSEIYKQHHRRRGRGIGPRVLRCWVALRPLPYS